MNLSEKQMVELANKIANKLFFMSGVNEVAHELIPARTINQTKQLAGGYNRSEFVQEVILVMRSEN
jgi:hypothetical protein